MPAIARRWFYAVPVTYLALLLWIQPADRIVMPWMIDNSPQGKSKAELQGKMTYPLPAPLSRWVTDDCDALAYAIRAENAARGRKAGLTREVPDPLDPTGPARREAYEPWDDADRPNATLLDRYFLEYPPLALAYFRLGLIGAPLDPQVEIHPRYLDCHQAHIGSFEADSPEASTVLRSYRHACRVYAVLMALAVIGLCIALDVRSGLAWPVWCFVLPGFLYFSLCRFDILPAGLVLISLLLADRRRVWLAGLALGLAVALKMYPLAIAPILLRFSARSWGQAAAWCVAAALPIALSYGAMLVSDGPDGAIIPLKFQLQRAYEPGWVFFDRFIPVALADKNGTSSLARLLCVFVPAMIVCIVRPPSLDSALRRCAAIVVLFISFQTFFSPQWWIWIAVLLVPLVRSHPWLLGYIVFGDLWTYLHFPIVFDLGLGGEHDWVRSTHVWVRGLLYFGLVAAFVAIEWPTLFRPPPANS